MADETTPHGDENNTDPVTPEPEAEPTKEVDWKAESRKWENRAKENLAQARANEEAARRLAEFEESQKTEAQKTQERLEAAEKRASEFELRSMRAEVAAQTGVPVELLSGSTVEEIQEKAGALIEFRGEQAQPTGPVVPTEGVARGSGASQLTKSDIEDMSYEQINKARREGRLNRLLGIN